MNDALEPVKPNRPKERTLAPFIQVAIGQQLQPVPLQAVAVPEVLEKFSDDQSRLRALQTLCDSKPKTRFATAKMCAAIATGILTGSAAIFWLVQHLG